MRPRRRHTTLFRGTIHCTMGQAQCKTRNRKISTSPLILSDYTSIIVRTEDDLSGPAVADTIIVGGTKSKAGQRIEEKPDEARQEGGSHIGHIPTLSCGMLCASYGGCGQCSPPTYCAMCALPLFLSTAEKFEIIS